MGFTVAFSIVLAVAIFIALPYGISLLFHSYVRNASLLAILEGVVLARSIWLKKLGLEE